MTNIRGSRKQRRSRPKRLKPHWVHLPTNHVSTVDAVSDITSVTVRSCNIILIGESDPSKSPDPVSGLSSYTGQVVVAHVSGCRTFVAAKSAIVAQILAAGLHERPMTVTVIGGGTSGVTNDETPYDAVVHLLDTAKAALVSKEPLPEKVSDLFYARIYCPQAIKGVFAPASVVTLAICFALRDKFVLDVRFPRPVVILCRGVSTWVAPLCLLPITTPGMAEDTDLGRQTVVLHKGEVRIHHAGTEGYPKIDARALDAARDLDRADIAALQAAGALGGEVTYCITQPFRVL